MPPSKCIPEIYFICVDGMPGSGKTTLCAAVEKFYTQQYDKLKTFDPDIDQTMLFRVYTVQEQIEKNDLDAYYESIESLYKNRYGTECVYYTDREDPKYLEIIRKQQHDIINFQLKCIQKKTDIIIQYLKDFMNAADNHPLATIKQAVVIVDRSYIGDYIMSMNHACLFRLKMEKNNKFEYYFRNELNRLSHKISKFASDFRMHTSNIYLNTPYDVCLKRILARSKQYQTRTMMVYWYNMAVLHSAYYLSHIQSTEEYSRERSAIYSLLSKYNDGITFKDALGGPISRKLLKCLDYSVYIIIYCLDIYRGGSSCTSICEDNHDTTTIGAFAEGCLSRFLSKCDLPYVIFHHAKSGARQVDDNASKLGMLWFSDEDEHKCSFTKKKHMKKGLFLSIIMK